METSRDFVAGPRRAVQGSESIPGGDNLPGCDVRAEPPAAQPVVQPVVQPAVQNKTL